MQRRRCFQGGVTFLALSLGASSGSAQTFIERELRIPMAAAGPKGLQALLIVPNQPGRHPLALISHGSPPSAEAARKVHPYLMWPQAMEFARRGWGAAIVMRRGFGQSGGEKGEMLGACDHADYQTGADAVVADLQASIQYLGSLPEVDTSKMIALGTSAGGFASVALTAAAPPGLKAAISFAGGRGSEQNGQVCSPETLVKTFSNFGLKSRVPMLWVYAENDQYFPPALARRFYQAFTGAGGQARFVQTGPSGENGHFLFAQGIPVWTPIVDDYLRRERLVLRSELLPLPVTNLPPPRQLGAKGHEAFNAYLHAGPHKAFAVSSKGAFAWVGGRSSAKEAEEDAVANCQKRPGEACSAYVVDNQTRH